MSDSTNAEREGFSLSERVVGATLEKLFVQNKDRRMVYHMIDGTTYTTVALRIKFLDSVPFDYSNHKFVVAGNNNLVNMKQIQSFKDNMVVLKNEEVIKIPKKNFSQVKNTYQDYLFEINNN